MSLPEETLSNAEDFRRIKRQRSSEILTLPSGLRVRAYRPSPRWWVENGRDLPKEGMVAVSDAPTSEAPAPDPKKLIATAKLLYDLMEEMVLSPKIRLEPKAKDEVSCYDIDNEDLTYLMDYARGEITADGRRLDTFSEESGSASGSTGSGDVGNEPEPID